MDSSQGRPYSIDTLPLAMESKGEKPADSDNQKNDQAPSRELPNPSPEETFSPSVESMDPTSEQPIVQFNQPQSVVTPDIATTIIARLLANDTTSAPANAWMFSAALEKLCSQKITEIYTDRISYRQHEELKQQLFQRAMMLIGLRGYDREEFKGFRDGLMGTIDNIVSRALRDIAGGSEAIPSLPSVLPSQSPLISNSNLNTMEKRVIQRSQIRPKSFDNLNLQGTRFPPSRNHLGPQYPIADGRRPTTSSGVSGHGRAFQHDRPELTRSNSMDAFRLGDAEYSYSSGYMYNHFKNPSTGGLSLNPRVQASTGHPRLRPQTPVTPSSSVAFPVSTSPRSPTRQLSGPSRVRHMQPRCQDQQKALSLTAFGKSLPNIPIQQATTESGDFQSSLQNLFSSNASRYNSDYDEICRLGKGGFATVYRVRNYLDGREYAIKKVPIRDGHLSSQAKLAEIFKEIKILAKLEHNNVVRYYAAWIEGAKGMWERIPALVEGSGDSISLPTTIENQAPEESVTTAAIDFVPVGITRGLEDASVGVSFNGSIPDIQFGYDSSIDKSKVINSRVSQIADEEESEFKYTEGEASEQNSRNMHDNTDKKTIPDTGLMDDTSEVELISRSPEPFSPFLHRPSLPIPVHLSEGDSDDLDTDIPSISPARRPSFITNTDEELLVPFHDSQLASICENSDESADSAKKGDTKWSFVKQPKASSIKQDSIAGNMTSTNQTPGIFMEVGNKPNATVKSIIKAEVASKRLERREILTMMIKMSLHPLTLSHFLNPEPQLRPAPNIGSYDLCRYQKHCYHLRSSLYLFRQILDGVQYLHDKGIIHRDLKPGNIFLNIEGECQSMHNNNGCFSCKGRRLVIPKIGDFGLVADLVDGLVGADGDGNENNAKNGVVGTALYRPPPSSQAEFMEDNAVIKRAEAMPPVDFQSNNSSNIICAKTDVYALGIILLELLYKFNTGIFSFWVSYVVEILLIHAKGAERIIQIKKLRDQQLLPTDFSKVVSATVRVKQQEPNPSAAIAEATEKVGECIHGMTKQSRNKRWPLDKVIAHLDAVAEKCI